MEQLFRRQPQGPYVADRAVLFTAFIPFPLNTWTAYHLCGEGSEMSAQTQWLVLFLVAVGRFLCQSGRAMSS